MHRLPPSLFLYLSSTLLLSLSPALAQSDRTDTSGCMQLLGSAACPAYDGAYINPANLSSSFPFFNGVSTVAQFDAAVFGYLSNPNQYAQTQFGDRLGCSNASTAMLRYARTVLCSQWTNDMDSQGCHALFNATSSLDGPKMVCQQTCLDFASSETQLVNNPAFCPGPDLTDGRRARNIAEDFNQCTNWTMLATNNTNLCVLGTENNERNCGYGSSVSQLCRFCSNDRPDSCCYEDATNILPCGYTLPSRPSSTTSLNLPTASMRNAPAKTIKGGLTKGQVAGIAVGSVLGGLLVLALLATLLFLLHRRRRDRRGPRTVDHPTAAAAGSSSAFSSPPTTPETTYPQSQTRRNSWFTSLFLASINPNNGNPHSHNGKLASPDPDPNTAVNESKQPSNAPPFASQNPLSHNLSPPSAPGLVGLGVRGGSIPKSNDRDVVLGADGSVREGGVVSVLWAYSSTLADELSLRPGMRVRVLQMYDDGWATGEMVDGMESGRQGAFPLVCVTLNGANPPSGQSDSRSSLRSRSVQSSPRGTSLGLMLDGMDSQEIVATETGQAPSASDLYTGSLHPTRPGMDG